MAVQISGNDITVPRDTKVDRNLTVGGVLTYEDVTNVDSIGLVTARNGIEIGASPGVGASISVDGNAEFAGIVTATQFVGSGANLTGVASTENIRTNTNATFLQNINVSGTVTATSYAGDGSALTGIEIGLSTASAQVSGITTVIDLSKDDIRLDATGLVTVDTKGGSEGASHSLRIVNSGIATVTFNSYFKFPSGGAPNLPTASGAISMISFTVHTQGRVGVASVFLAGSSVNFS